MKTHIRRISTFLIYTFVFNAISFILTSFLGTYEHYFEAIILLVFCITQICFTILFFNRIPLYKISNDKGIKKDILLYFLILCVLATVNLVVFGGSSALFNTYTFAMSASRFDTFGIYMGICIIENAIKTYLLYTNISKKTLSKPICIVLSVIMVLPIIAFIVLLAKLNR